MSANRTVTSIVAPPWCWRMKSKQLLQTLGFCWARRFGAIPTSILDPGMVVGGSPASDDDRAAAPAAGSGPEPGRADGAPPLDAPVISNLGNSLKTWTLLAALGGLLIAVGGLLGG